VGLEAGGDEANLASGANIQFTQSAIVLESLISQFLYSSAEKQGTPSTSDSALAPKPAKAAQ